MPAGTMSFELRLELLLQDTRMHFEDVKSEVDSYFGSDGDDLNFGYVMSFLVFHRDTRLEVTEVLDAVTVGEEAARVAMLEKASNIYRSGELYEQWKVAMRDSDQGSHRFRMNKWRR